MKKNDEKLEMTSEELSNVDLEEKEAEERRKKSEKVRAQSDYEKYLAKVMEMKEMTDTSGWRSLWSKLQERRTRANEDLLSEDSTRPMIRFQEQIKLIDEFADNIKQCIEALDNYCHSMPLFAGDFKTRAVWNKNLGTITIRSIND